MKQFNKLLQVVRDPRPFGLRKNTRTYNHIITLLLKGVAQTGYSNKGFIMWRPTKCTRC